MGAPDILLQRRNTTETKLHDLVAALAAVQAQQIVDKCACVYAIGSVGRGEVTDSSDLDIFIIRDRTTEHPLTNLNEIRLKARLIEVARELNFPEFSDDGEYVKSYDIKDDFIEKLGTRLDDYENVLTARMLLLLESRPILGTDIYKQAIDRLLAEYWRDYSQNSSDFLPVFLINDILRFWKTLCLNYEERTADEKTGKRRLLNYKLKYSRLLTCYSAIVYLQAILRRDNGTVNPEAAMEMVSISPTQRLEFVAQTIHTMKEPVSTILDNYSGFLEMTAERKSTLQLKFEETEFKKARFGEARQFGRDVFKLLHLMGENTDLLRYIVV